MHNKNSPLNTYPPNKETVAYHSFTVNLRRNNNNQVFLSHNNNTRNNNDS